MASETTFDHWKVVFLMRKSEKKALTFEALSSRFKTYIFGILAQFVTIWHQQKRWVFFFDYRPLQDPCAKYSLREA